MLLSSLLQQARREAAHQAALSVRRLGAQSAAATAATAASAAAATTTAVDATLARRPAAAPWPLARSWASSSCVGFADCGARRGFASTSAAAAAEAAAAAAAAAASAEAAAPPRAPKPPAPYPGWRPPAPPPPALPPDHLQSRPRGFRPAAHALGRRTARALVARYPYPVRYHAPKPVFLYDLEGRALAVRELPGDVFSAPVRIDVLHRVVRWQRAKARQGTHKAKTRAEVSGGGRKPWRQKGTGKARQGSIRAPQWKGGGAAHGPVPRSHAHKLPKKVRRLGLRCALSAKAHEGNLLLVDSLRPSEPKTKLMAAALEKLLAGRPRRSALLIDSDKAGADGGARLRRAAGNLAGVDVVPAAGANVYGILKRDVLVLTAAAADALVERLRRPINRLGAAGRAHAARMAAARARREAAGAAAGSADGGAP